ncbi:hypothetical protein Tco_0218953 [Tanacetum coccineum]
MSTQQDINAFRAQRIANTHDPLALMENTQTPFHLDHSSLITYMQHPKPNNNFVSQPLFHTNYLQRPMQNPGDISNPTTAFNMALQLNDNVGNQFRQNAMQNVGNQVVLNASQNSGVQNVRNQNGLSVVSEIANQHGDGNVVTALAEGNGNGINGACKETKRANVNCTLENKSSSGTQSDKAPVYDSDGSAENDSNVISVVSSVEQSGGTVEQHPANIKETHAYFESLYNNLATEVEKVNLVNRKMKETNAELTTELASNAQVDNTEFRYNGKSVYLKKHDPPAVHDSEETMQLAQESRLKMKHLNKEIKPANYTKINHLSRFLFLSNAVVTRKRCTFEYFQNGHCSNSISNTNEE